MIKYLGSKRTLAGSIVEVVQSLPEVCSVADYFSGTSRVGHALKNRGYQVIANDHLTYAYVIASCYVRADVETVGEPARKLLRELSCIPGRPGYFTDTFCVKSRFFQEHNGARIDAIRECIQRKSLDPDLESVLLVSLMEAADRVDSTTGVQMAYLKSWAGRSFKELELRMPAVLPRPVSGRCESHQLDALRAASELTADLAYIDPPYNQHSYLGNYHIWETMARWDKPEHYGIACKRMDCKERKSAFNSRRFATETFRKFLAELRCPFKIVSFSNEGYIPRAEMEQMLSVHGEVHVLEFNYKRYVGAQIGIHDLNGNRVGKVSHLENKEYLYVVVPRGYSWSPNCVRSYAPQGLQRSLFDA